MGGLEDLAQGCMMGELSRLEAWCKYPGFRSALVIINVPLTSGLNCLFLFSGRADVKFSPSAEVDQDAGARDAGWGG
jgi:hypothetical protein